MSILGRDTRVTAFHGSRDVQVSISADLRAVERELGVVIPRVVKAATISALNKCSTKARGRAVKAVAAKIGVPQKTIRKRTRRFMAHRGRLVTGIYIHYAAIPADALASPSRLRQTKKGARAGRRFWKGAFVATPTWGDNEGRKSIYGRVKKDRMPIRKKYLLWGDSTAVFTRASRDVVKNDLGNLYRHELKRRLKSGR